MRVDPVLCWELVIILPVGGQTEWLAGHSGDTRHFASPVSVMRDREHHRRPADTWVTPRESEPHLASLFHLPVLNAPPRHAGNAISMKCCVAVSQAFVLKLDIH